ncbi:MAG: isoamylase early set domain-containing protein [Gemmatimonadaceae bacterium]|jgi:hypothetical protein|nr:isoamylase early set domain-containing protein [Gemmatimonadaceae bacterium]
MRDEVMHDPVLRPLVETARQLPDRNPALVARILAATATPVRRPWWQRWTVPAFAMATLAATIMVWRREAATPMVPAVATSGTDSVQPTRVAPASPVAPVASGDGVLPATVPVRFAFDAAAATTVHLVGDFNGWDATATPMQRAGDGRWVSDVALAPGRHVYAFVVDGTQWLTDPHAPRASDDDFGQGGSVLMVRVP